MIGLKLRKKRKEKIKKKKIKKKLIKCTYVGAFIYFYGERDRERDLLSSLQ